MKKYLPLLGGIAFILLVQSLLSMESRLGKLESWLKEHKDQFNTKES